MVSSTKTVLNTKNALYLSCSLVVALVVSLFAFSFVAKSDSQNSVTAQITKKSKKCATKSIKKKKSRTLVNSCYKKEKKKCSKKKGSSKKKCVSKASKKFKKLCTNHTSKSQWKKSKCKKKSTGGGGTTDPCEIDPFSIECENSTSSGSSGSSTPCDPLFDFGCDDSSSSSGSGFGDDGSSSSDSGFGSDDGSSTVEPDPDAGKVLDTALGGLTLGASQTDVESAVALNGLGTINYDRYASEFENSSELNGPSHISNYYQLPVESSTYTTYLYFDTSGSTLIGIRTDRPSTNLNHSGVGPGAVFSDVRTKYTESNGTGLTQTSSTLWFKSGDSSTVQFITDGGNSVLSVILTSTSGGSSSTG